MMGMTATSTEPVTAVVSRLVKPGYESAYEQWVEGITRACARFEGYMGSDFIRPMDGIHPQYVTIFRFDNYNHLRCWQESDDVRYWLSQVRGLIIRESDIQLQSGLEFWFAPERPPAPSIFKQSVVTWIGLTPLVLFVPPLLAPYLGWLPEWLAITVSTGVTVLMMSYWVMPITTRVFRGYLDPHR